MLHLHTLSVLIGRAKTRKTLCGLRRPEKELATGDQTADCPACRSIKDEEMTGMRHLLKHAEETGCATDELRKAVERAESTKYQNAEFLR